MLKKRLQCPTRSTPGSPKIDHQYFPFLRGERERRATRSGPQCVLEWLLGLRISSLFRLRSGNADLIVDVQQEFAQPVIRAVREPPNVPQFLTNFSTARRAVRRIRQRERAGIF